MLSINSIIPQKSSLVKGFSKKICGFFVNMKESTLCEPILSKKLFLADVDTDRLFCKIFAEIKNA